MDFVRSTIQQAIVTVKPELSDQELTDTSTLSDLGLDSIRLVELGVHLEHALGGEISFDDWLDQERSRSTNAFTIGSLVAFIHASGGSVSAVQP